VLVGVLAVGGYYAIAALRHRPAEIPVVQTAAASPAPAQPAPAPVPAPVPSAPAAAPATTSPAGASSSFVLPAAPQPAPAAAAPVPEAPPPPAVAPPPPEPAPAPVKPAAPPLRLEPRAVAYIENLRIVGIRVSPTDSKVLMNDRVYRIGDVVEYELGLKLTGITSSSLTFEDPRVAVYTRSF
jgi:hypothetical protein